MALVFTMTGLSPVRKQYPSLGTPIFKSDPIFSYRGNEIFNTPGKFGTAWRRILDLIKFLREAAKIVDCARHEIGRYRASRDVPVSRDGENRLGTRN